jgi:hypothetical protein
LELGFERASGLSLRRAKARDKVRRQRQGVGMDGQTPGYHRFPVHALD